MSIPDFRDQSMLRVISVGVAAENKELNSIEVEAVISEQLTFANGELKSDFTTDIAKGVDSQGRPFEVTVNMANTVLASWLGDGTNRASAPDVRRGDRLEILQYGEVDKFYWRARPLPGSSVRKLETVTTSYSNTRDEQDNVPTANNSWFSEVNTHSKTWTLAQTNKNDGEDYAYTQQIDAKAGNMVVGADDAGNFIQINSKDGLVEVENAHKSFIHLDQGKLIIEADEIIINGRKSVNVTTPQATYDQKSATFKSEKWTVAVPTTSWTGQINLNGGVSVEGGGGFDCKGTAKFTGTITHMGIDIGSNHKHMVKKEGQLTESVSPG